MQPNFSDVTLLAALVPTIALGLPLYLVFRRVGQQNKTLETLETRLNENARELRDFEKHLEAERTALFENRGLLSQLSDIPGVAVAMFDEKSGLLWSTRSWDSRLWVPEGEGTLTQRIAQFATVEDAAKATQLANLEPGNLVTVPVQLSLGENRSRRGSLSAQLIRDEAGTRLLLCFFEISSERLELETLQRAKNRTDAILESGAWGTWEWETEANLCHWDERAGSLFGRKPGSFDEWMACFNKGDLPHLENNLRSALLGYSGVDATVRTAGANARHLLLRGRVLRGKDGKPGKIVGVVSDISDDLVLREQLRLVGERLRLALAGSRDGIWEWQGDMEQFVVDDHWLALTGCKHDGTSLTREAFESLIHPEDLRLFRGALEAQNDRDCGMLDFECRINAQDRDWVWLRWRGTVVSRDSSGRARSLCGTYSDVTERHRNEDALRRSSLLLRQVCQQMGIAAWELDASTFMLQWTEELDLLHATPADFEPSLERLLSLYPQDARRELTHSIEVALETDEHFDIEVRWMPPGGASVLWYRWTGHPVRNEGKTVAVCGLIQDVTSAKESAVQRRNLDARLAELRQYEALSAITDDLAYDLNSLLVSLLGFQELACEELPGGNKARSYVLEAMRTGNRTHDIIKQVLLLNRVKPAARIGLKPQLLLDEVCERLRSMLPETVTLEREIDRQCPSVLGDAAQLQHCFMNIATQAVSILLDKTGTLLVTLRKCDLSLEEAARLGLALSGEFMQLGIRIHASTLSKEEWLALFNHPLRDPGLQIASAKKVIGDHQGILHCHAEGSEFGICEIFLPLSKTLREHPPSSEPMPRGSGEKIWIMDEERFVARLAKLFLERNGYAVRLFRNYAELAPSLENRSYECAAILLGTSGVSSDNSRTAFEEVRRLAPGLPVILIGGNKPEDIESVAARLAEPFSAADLARAVHEALHPAPAGLRILGTK